MSGRRRKLRVGLAALLTVCLAVVVAACGSDSGGGGGSGSEKKITGAKVIDPASMDSPPKGTIHYCQGKDTNGSAHENVALFNKKYASQGYKVELTEFPASADQQRAQFIQRQQAKSDDCDVFSSDVIWTAEFASQKWLYDMTPYVEKAKDKYIGAPLETVHYGGKYWGAPASSDAAFIFYRTDKGSGKATVDLAGGLRRRQEERRPRLPGRAVRGPDLRLPRARVRRRRQGALRRRQEVRDRFAGEREGAAADGRRHQGRRGSEGRDDLHGAGDRPGVGQRPLRLHAQLDLRLRAAQRQGRAEGRGQVQGRAAARPSRAPARPASSAVTTA